MNWLKNLIRDNWFTRIIDKIKAERKYRKKLAEVKKRDPYIYK
jgi:hypothetical protein